MTLVKIGKAAEMLGVDVQTLRAWEKSGELVPDRRNGGATRYYDVGKIMGLGNEDMPTIGDARVSSHDRKATSSAGRSCLKPSVPPKAGGMRSLPTSVLA